MTDRPRYAAQHPRTPYPSPFDKAALERDPFIRKLMERLPEHLRHSFSPEQVEALRDIYGSRTRNRHRVDLRGTLNLFGSRYYFTILAGRNKRSTSQRQGNLSLAAKAMLATVFLLFSTLLGLLILYLLKSALGINLLPGYSFGLWDWFKANIW